MDLIGLINHSIAVLHLTSSFKKKNSIFQYFGGRSRKLRVQSHCWPHNKLKVSQCYRKPASKRRKLSKLTCLRSKVWPQQLEALMYFQRTQVHFQACTLGISQLCVTLAPKIQMI